LPAAKLQRLRAALPHVAFPRLAQIFASTDTLWYDGESMKPSYQAAVLESPPWGANSNDRWFNLIASPVAPTANNFYDRSLNRFKFPFGTTAGTDNSTNLTVFNFLSLPSRNGRLLPVAVRPRPQRIAGSGFTMNSWGWLYPNGAVLGELLFVTTGSGDLLPVEVRTRTRTPNGWAINAFRPFPTADALDAAIKAHRPDWQSRPALAAMVQHLERTDNLVRRSLHTPNVPGVFDQDGAVDVLPDFGDAALVRELLTQTTFVSAYGAIWKQGNGLVTYAASTSASPSIVPTNYDAGLMEVSDESCMRCHQETGRHLVAFKPEYRDIVLYGEMWGRDGIFSFHPFDESRYDIFWNTSYQDNRRLNPTLSAQGVIANYNANQHRAPDYPADEIVGNNG
jgi:hypothetical protein